MGTRKGQLSNEHPNQHDFDQLIAIYAGKQGGRGGSDGDSGDCNPKSPKCNPSALPNDRAAWGRLISARGGIEVYERIMTNGLRVLTHVTWTLEHAESEAHGH